MSRRRNDADMREAEERTPPGDARQSATQAGAIEDARAGRPFSQRERPFRMPDDRYPSHDDPFDRGGTTR